MKIVCDNCATKYSIADEKVRGKVFKIRCKKCSHIIVVRGGESAAQDGGQTGDAGFPSDAGNSVADGNVWHLVIDREQVGPLSAEEVRTKFTAGQIDGETYAWKEGFNDWLRLGSIEEFKDLERGAAPVRRASANVFGALGNGQSSADAGDPFGGAAVAAGGGGRVEELFSAGGGLFGGGAPAASRAAAEPMAPALSSAAAPEPVGSGPVEVGLQMKGQRNENSVLFSLNNLQALASGGAAAATKSDPRPGYASSQSEGSGLIDIRAMAASTLASRPKEEGVKGPGFDTPSFSSAPVFTPMAAPILMPTPTAGPPKWMWPVLGTGVVAVLGIVGVGVLLIKKQAPPVVMTAMPTAPTGLAPAAPATTGVPAIVRPTTAAPSTAVAPAMPKTEEDPKAHRRGSHEKSAKLDKGTKLAKVEPVASAPAVASPPVTSKRSGGTKKDALDDLLDGASPESKPSRPAREDRSSASDDKLPEQLDKAAIVSGMSKIKGRVGACYDQYKVPGMANVSVTIVKSGRVQSANVSGAFAGTPTGDCVTRAVKSASFSPFKGAAQTINYPFMLR